VKGPHEECRFSLTHGLERLLLCEGGEWGTIVPHGLLTIVDAIVPDGWHTTAAALVERTNIFLRPQWYQNVKFNYQLLVLLLAGRGRCPPRYGNNDANQITSLSIRRF
jgi:hypothetical protein